jgi:hypothetical protein
VCCERFRRDDLKAVHGPTSVLQPDAGATAVSKVEQPFEQPYRTASPRPKQRPDGDGDRRLLGSTQPFPAGARLADPTLRLV